MVSTLTYKKALTAIEIAEQVGIRRQNVLKSSALADYFVGTAPNPSGKGRPVKLYRPEVLTIWGASTADIAEIKTAKRRRTREDKGKLRKVQKSEMDQAIEQAHAEYMASAMPNLKYACEQAALKMAKAGYSAVTAQRLYKRLTRRDNHRGRKFIGQFYSEGWRIQHEKRYKMKNFHHQHATLRHSWWELLESAGVAGRGFGAMQIIVVDDFKRDAWAIGDDDKLTMPLGIQFTCGLTRKPLITLPVESITTQAVATGMLMVATAYGLPKNAVWQMENSRAMKNIPLEQLARYLYTDEELFDFDEGRIDWIKEIFYGQTGPVVRNNPHNPRYAGKAIIERSFKIVKDEFDAPTFARNFQGGSRFEATQLNMASQPIIVNSAIVNLDNLEIPPGINTEPLPKYFVMLDHYLRSEFVNRLRPGMHGDWARSKNDDGIDVLPRIQDCWEYYYDPNCKREIDFERLVYMLYWAQPERHKHLFKIRSTGLISPTINGRRLNLIHDRIGAGTIGRKIATIPIPGRKDHFALFLADDIKEPEFLCIAEDFTARDINKVAAQGQEVRRIRENINTDIESRSKTMAVHEIMYPAVAAPEPADWTKELIDDRNKKLACSIQSTIRSTANGSAGSNEEQSSPPLANNESTPALPAAEHTSSKLDELIDDLFDL